MVMFPIDLHFTYPYNYLPTHITSCQAPIVIPICPNPQRRNGNRAHYLHSAGIFVQQGPVHPISATVYSG